jgi:hypothetical protein
MSKFENEYFVVATAFVRNNWTFSKLDRLTNCPMGALGSSMSERETAEEEETSPST